MIKRKNDILIDLIQGIRTKNNRNWIMLLRIAMKADETRTKKVLKSINDCDKKISNLMEKLSRV